MTDHSSRSHKRFAASAAERWMNCPGSIRLCESLPEPPPSPYALEGTLAHEWLQYKMVGGAKPKQEATPEMLMAIEEFKDIVRKTLPAWAMKLIIERPVEFRIEDIGGTMDFAAYHEETNQAWFFDFKYGAGVTVEVKGNKQLRIYAQSSVDTYSWNPTTLHLGIFQPRAFHEEGRWRTETITRAELFDFHQDVLDARALCLEPDAPLIPGEEQCRWCPAKAVCPAREKMALAVVNSSFNHVKQITPESLPAVKEMTPDRIGQILAVKKMVVDWLDSVEEEGRNQALSGVAIPGMKLVEPVGRRSWEGEKLDLMIQLAAITKTEPSNWTEMQLVGVTEADKRFKEATKDFSKQDKEAAKIRYTQLTTKKSSGNLQLVPESDRRAGVQSAGQAFGGVVQLPLIAQTGE